MKIHIGMRCFGHYVENLCPESMACCLLYFLISLTINPSLLLSIQVEVIDAALTHFPIWQNTHPKGGSIMQYLIKQSFTAFQPEGLTGTSAGFDGRLSCPCRCVKWITDLSLGVYGLSHSTALWEVKTRPVSLSPMKVSLDGAMWNGEPTCLFGCREVLCPWHCVKRRADLSLWV